MSVERRNLNRDPCHLDASIVAGSSGERIGCVVEDISEAGARLMFDDTIELPDTFKLLLPLIGPYADERAVELLWQKGTLAGVRFVV